MKRWVPLLLVSLFFFSGCSSSEQKTEKRVHFSVLVPKAVAGQTTGFVEGIAVITSRLPHTTVSAMVVNNPIRADKEALIAVAIENDSNRTIPLEWEDIVFFNPKNIVKMLPPEQVCRYFEEPGHTKPVLGSKIFKKELIEMDVLSEEPTPPENLSATASRLAEIYRNIKKDLCFVSLPHDTTLKPHEVTAGFLVIVLPKKHFVKSTQFMLKIPVNGDLHKLRYTLKPIR